MLHFLLLGNFFYLFFPFFWVLAPTPDKTYEITLAYDKEPETITDTNRGSTTQPDVEDINQDNTMNTIDSYFEYELDITPASLANLTASFCCPVTATEPY